GGEGLGQGGNEGGGLLAVVDVVDHVAVVGAQHATVIAHAHPGHLVGGDVHHPGGCLAEEAVLPLQPDGPHHVVPLLDLGNQARNFLRRVLQVGIQCDDDLERLAKPPHDGEEPVHERDQVPLLIVGRDDDRYIGRFHCVCQVFVIL